MNVKRSRTERYGLEALYLLGNEQRFGVWPD